MTYWQYRIFRGKSASSAIFFVTQICEYVQSILILSIFHRLIHAYKAQNRNETTKTILPSKVHGSTLVLLIFISTAYLTTQAMSSFGSDEDYDWNLTQRLQLACDGLILIASLDIMFKIFTVIRESKNAKCSSMVRCSPWLASCIVEVLMLTDKQNGAPSLAVGGFFLFTYSLFLLVMDNMKSSTQEKIISIQEIVTAICTMGQCIGIVHCCMQQHRLGVYGLRSPSSADDERAHILTASNEGML
ncbi:uncharacterized protein BO72DRAFT_186619 [Aspergillus fijiensis CBS 313.89]|uniref:Uncharacterized protein n=1 Tax=Aspergillus fijiensis CBS 313.89 TaxID=1448319 RepID=A0A8G1VWC5_9EURO|nr:uncharacterized protein BO72DRAFT_186619 [Aspergillus fijiensis CBS 313.89]RAK75077.1 hypothetical protein BO72DRAFT_186619 [Aspergillus fijiensis CBS 313.89]